MSGVAAHVTGEAPQMSRSGVGWGQAELRKKVNVPVSGALEASRAVWVGFWGDN